MPGGGVTSPYDQYGNKINYGGTPNAPITSFGDPKNYTAAANTQAGDYDKIMAQYDALSKNFNANPITAGTVGPATAQTTPYSQSADVTSSLSKLSDLATTGGYSAGDIADIRARDIAPTRSIYANAQQNVERNKSLAGGYSPNYGAVSAKMARDESNQIGDQTTAANAGIAQNVAANKLSAAPAYASASASANAAKAAADQRNTDIINQINQFNTGISEYNNTNSMNAQLANRQGQSGILEGMRNLYGTTPALTQTFGNQVIQAGQLGQGQQQLNNQRRQQIFGMSGGA